MELAKLELKVINKINTKLGNNREVCSSTAVIFTITKKAALGSAFVLFAGQLERKIKDDFYSNPLFTRVFEKMK